MLVGGVVDHQFSDYLEPASVRFPNQLAEIAHGAECRIDAHVVGDVVAVIAQR